MSRPKRTTVLHVSAQRPSLTGSGVTLDALVRNTALAGWEQAAIVGTPADDPAPDVGGLPPAAVHTVRFDEAPLDFPIPGMSDVMPYRSSRYSELSADQLERYRRAWRDQLRRVAAEVGPDLVHVHHAWLVAAAVPDACPGVPTVVHCHATGLRQMSLCPHLADEVRRGVRRNDRFVALHPSQAEDLAAALGIGLDRVDVVGAGFREDLFAPDTAVTRDPQALLYAGKLSRAKGLPWLLDAFERLRENRQSVTLHVAGTGAGPEAEALRDRMSTAPGVVAHGHIDQPALADLMRRSAVFVLPSFYEGLPLVLVEALACGCRPVCTALPAVVSEIVPVLGDDLGVVAMPRMRAVDVPVEEDLPAFLDELSAVLGAALDAPPLDIDPAKTRHFGWTAVFERIEAVWRSLVGAEVVAGDR